jgi:hypothetical protein
VSDDLLFMSDDVPEELARALSNAADWAERKQPVEDSVNEGCVTIACDVIRMERAPSGVLLLEAKAQKEALYDAVSDIQSANGRPIKLNGSHTTVILRERIVSYTVDDCVIRLAAAPI